TLWGNDPASWQAATPPPGVNPTSGGPRITSTPNTRAMATTVYQYTITATGNPAPTFTVQGLPAWLLFDGINKISGTVPSMATGVSYNVTVTAQNGQGQDTQQYTFTVVPYRAPDRSIWKIF
ncbi:MAG TPA: putative Ig domain-containing protein, partial [Candidatus Sumerlaeota bacterium]|nr:putative Ig domain-containing protein [Candidatus Sumerlaeota bacterium]